MVVGEAPSPQGALSPPPRRRRSPRGSSAACAAMGIFDRLASSVARVQRRTQGPSRGSKAESFAATGTADATHRPSPPSSASVPSVPASTHLHVRPRARLANKRRFRPARPCCLPNDSTRERRVLGARLRPFPAYSRSGLATHPRTPSPALVG